MSEVMIQADGLVKIYKSKQTEVLALQGLDLTVEKGELTALIGNSGSGKSTFLNMIGGLDRPSAGSLLVDGKNLFTMGERELVCYKRDTVGFVWQNNARNLLPYLSALENIMLPMHISGQKKKKEKALELLEQVGMTAKRNNRLNTMSGGEQQRVSIARALAKNPKLLLCDEPTGALDYNTGKAILKLLQDMCREKGMTVIVITHNSALAPMADRLIKIKNGKVSSMITNENPVSIDEIEW